MIEEFEEIGASIVVVGDFAPRAFHPYWFQSHNLLGKEEVKSSIADPTFVIVERLANFKVGAFDIQITPERFQVMTNREDYFDPVRDLAQGSLTVLDTNPTRAIGFNWNVHFKAGSEAAWHAVGDKLTPKKMWRSFWQEHVGMQDVTMRLARDDGLEGHITVSVQPSTRVQYGVYIGINDHIDFAKRENFCASELAQFVQAEWDKARSRGKKLLNAIYTGVTKNEPK